MKSRFSWVGVTLKYSLFRLLVDMKLYVPVSERWGWMEPSRLFVVPSPSDFIYNLNFALHGSTDDQAYIWLIAMSEFLDFMGMAFVVDALDGIVP